MGVWAWALSNSSVGGETANGGADALLRIGLLLRHARRKGCIRWAIVVGDAANYGDDSSLVDA